MFGNLFCLRVTFEWQVLPIWEGTTNILSLDVLRALLKSEGRTLQTFHRDIEDRLFALSSGHPQELSDAFQNVRAAANEIVKFAAERQDILEAAARDFAYSLARTYMGEFQFWPQESYFYLN